MRRRMFVAAIALGGASLALVVGIAPAAGKAGRKASAPHVLVVRCEFRMTIQPPPGATYDTPPVQKGVAMGDVFCPSPKGFGVGAIQNRFITPASGDMVGHYVQYFNSGTIGGRLDLVPKGGSFNSSTGFQSQNWSGTFKVWYGTGGLTGVKSTQPATMSCRSPDSVHLSCLETMTVHAPKSG